MDLFYCKVLRLIVYYIIPFSIYVSLEYLYGNDFKNLFSIHLVLY